MEFKITQIRERAWDDRNRRGKTIVYCSLDESILDNMVNRFDRPHKIWRQGVIDALKAKGMNVEKISWSQKAGCGCGCSPGFKVDGHYHHDIWIDVKGTPVVVENPVRVAHRKAAIGL